MSLPLAPALRPLKGDGRRAQNTNANTATVKHSRYRQRSADPLAATQCPATGRSPGTMAHTPATAGSTEQPVREVCLLRDLRRQERQGSRQQRRPGLGRTMAQVPEKANAAPKVAAANGADAAKD